MEGWREGVEESESLAGIEVLEEEEGFEFGVYECVCDANFGGEGEGGEWGKSYY